MIKDVIFDLGGVLINLDTKKMQEACVRNKINPELFFVSSEKQSVSTVCHGLDASPLLVDYQIGLISTEDLLSRALPYCPEGTTAEMLIETWNACLGDIPKARLDMIKNLRGKGYRTHLLSNTNSLHWDAIVEEYFQKEGYTTDDLFDTLFLSHEMHLAKPGKEIYETVLKTLSEKYPDLKAEEVVFVDDAKINAEAASRQGIRGYWLDLTKETVVDLIDRLGLTTMQK